MDMRGIGIVLLFTASGCGAAAQLALKKPIAKECAGTGLNGCDELTDAAIAYVSGEKAEAEPKLRAAVAANSPEQMSNFASALKPIADSAVGDTGERLRSVISILTSSPSRASANTHDAARAAIDGLSADEHEQLRTFTAAAGPDAKSTECGGGPLAAGSARCMRTRVTMGPFVVTNVYASGGCPDELFVMTGSMARPQWFLLAPAAGPANIVGKFSVEDGEGLFVGARSANPALSVDIRCAITWSGYRPHAVSAAASRVCEARACASVRVRHGPRYPPHEAWRRPKPKPTQRLTSTTMNPIA